MNLYRKGPLLTFYSLIIIILINIGLFIVVYKKNIDTIEEKNLDILANVVYLLEQVSSGYYGSNEDGTQFQSIIYMVSKNNDFNISLTDTPLYKTTFDKAILNHIAAENDPIQAIKTVLAHESKLASPENQFGISFLLSPENKWVNIKPTIAFSMNAISLLSLQLFLSIILIIHALSIYRLRKPWLHINDSLVELGLTANDLKMPFYGPRLVTSFAILIDKIIKRVKQLIQERTTTIAALSHDIRTPLTKLRWSIELMDNPALHQALLPKIDQIEQFLKIVLDFAKESYQEEAKNPLEIISLLEVICEEYDHTNVTLSLHNTSKFIVNAQRRNLIRAFGNLIDNGLKYGNKVEVIIKKIRKNTLQIIIRDQGKGIPEHLLNKVFEPFFRYIAADKKDVAGSGLGLAFVKSVITFNNGNIRLENNAQGGLDAIVTFTVI